MIFNIVGVGGVTLVLVAYLLLQAGKLSSENLWFLWMNIIGSGGILFSLFHNFNLASALIETCWVLISLFGLIRVLHKKKQFKKQTKVT